MRLTLALAVLVACKKGGDSDVPTAPDTDPGDTDAGDTDPLDTDTDPDPPPAGLDCDDPAAYPTPAPGGQGLATCVTDTIACGEVIRATNTGGSLAFGTENGENLWMCSGSAEGQDFAGPDRVYQMNLPPEVYALEAHVNACQPTWILWHRSATSCPTEPVNCGFAYEGGPNDPWDSLLVGPLGTVHFIVEGFQNQGGNFELRVDCFDDQGALVTP